MTTSDRAPHQFIIERTFQAPIEDVWALWTTPDGIESWWGPEGFTAKVHQLDLRPGGEVRYDMIATAPEQIAFMKQAGMPLSTPTRMVFIAVEAPRRLAYANKIDFIPGVTPYDVATVVELHPVADGVRMVITEDALHDAVWTERAKMGMESQLGKMPAALAARRK